MFENSSEQQLFLSVNRDKQVKITLLGLAKPLVSKILRWDDVGVTAVTGEATVFILFAAILFIEASAE